MNELVIFCTQNVALLAAIVIFELIFKGIALWHSARRGQNVWFVFLLIINSIGILPIIYLLIYRKKK
jgi:methionyl-tRNA synthetase